MGLLVAASQQTLGSYGIDVENTTPHRLTVFFRLEAYNQGALTYEAASRRGCIEGNARKAMDWDAVVSFAESRPATSIKISPVVLWKDLSEPADVGFNLGAARLEFNSFKDLMDSMKYSTLLLLMTEDGAFLTAEWFEKESKPQDVLKHTGIGPFKTVKVMREWSQPKPTSNEREQQ